ncbi:diphthamide biosynthesis protein 2 [Truncatella angustata]|uniref:2-(3-amino-3-carboxypropyl)histidine synthase subunit 2 n=1 Tax=Truncatella angustata TaxID=152316 RepID=A0A9P8UTH7_9PEZI|nr:diphthamide biosynthesis protein 2 [Truncatella angustata]KAH6657924.1 diphthamide biosynthesis protein 2 [Truncatella angustata]
MGSELTSAPVLSTPAEHTFSEDPTSTSALETQKPKRSDDELFSVYEVERTAAEIAQQGWRRVALQFPDAMLSDSTWVVEALSKELGRIPRLYVLADTSYSSCCIDEIAAEHADADAVVHYGRACLSPTARLPVLHVFTRQQLDYDVVLEAFERDFGNNKGEKVVLMADVMFQDHVRPLSENLRERGWTNIRATEIVRDPSATIPNRRVISLDENAQDIPAQASETSPESQHQTLNDHHLFHISTPPQALLLTLSSRLSSLRIYTTPVSPYTTAAMSIPDPSMTPRLLQRRYGLVIRFATASVIGILVNTLSVANYLPTITKLREQIAAAGKKSYTIVVGKLNSAKLANFAEVDGWVVVGCWESGLVEQDGMWKPVITPFELELALVGDDKRIWDGTWWGGIEGVRENQDSAADEHVNDDITVADAEVSNEEVEGGVDDEESEAPEFDLRTGKFVSNSRPMRLAVRNQQATTNGRTATEGPSTTKNNEPSKALTQRKLGEVAMVNGVVSPGAEYLRSQRTWQGLGTDFRDVDEDEQEYEESTVIQEGRSGVARGYTVGETQGKS